MMYLEVPLNFVYYLSVGQVGNVFAGAGPYAGYGLRVKTKEGADSESGSFKDAEMKPFEAGLNFLLGFKLNSGLLINGGYGLGLTKINDDGDSKSKNRVFSVGIGFQI